MHLTYRLDQLFRRTLFCEVARRSSLQYSYAVLILRMYAQDQHGKFWAIGFQLFQDIESASSRHIDVQHHDIPLLGAYKREQLSGVFCFASDNHIRLPGNNLLEAAPNYRVIVRNENPDHSCERLQPQESGIVTVTVVPSSGVPLIFNVPPNR